MKCLMSLVFIILLRKVYTQVRDYNVFNSGSSLRVRPYLQPYSFEPYIFKRALSEKLHEDDTFRNAPQNTLPWQGKRYQYEGLDTPKNIKLNGSQWNSKIVPYPLQNTKYNGLPPNSEFTPGNSQNWKPNKSKWNGNLAPYSSLTTKPNGKFVPDTSLNMKEKRSKWHGMIPPYASAKESPWYGMVVPDTSQNIKLNVPSRGRVTKLTPVQKANPNKSQWYNRIASQENTANGSLHSRNLSSNNHNSKVKILPREKTLPLISGGVKPNVSPGRKIELYPSNISPTRPPWFKIIPDTSKYMQANDLTWIGKIIPITYQNTQPKISPWVKVPSYTSQNYKPNESYLIKIIPLTSQNIEANGSPWLGKIIPYTPEKAKSNIVYQWVESLPHISRNYKTNKSLWVKIVPYTTENNKPSGSPRYGKVVPYPFGSLQYGNILQ